MGNNDYLAKGVKRYLMYCPFCGCTRIRGYEETYWDNRQFPHKVYWYSCKNCKAQSGKFSTRDEANVAWNRRVHYE